jgi:pimeloyl-ACP methyl ester carboxylesterase
MPYTQLPDARLYVEEHGDGPPLLLIHGTGSDADVWGSAIDDLSRLCRVISYDRRGFSRSAWPDLPPRTTPVPHAHDAVALLEALDASPAVIIGRSYGGNVALELALRYPDYVKALVLLEGGGEALSPEVQTFIEELLARVRAAVAAGGLEAVGEALMRVVLGDDGYEAMPDERKQRTRDNGATILAELEGFFDVQPGPEQLRRIACPVLVVSATTSPPALQRCNETLVAALPDARLATVGGGHLIIPADEQVVDFIREVRAAQ